MSIQRDWILLDRPHLGHGAHSGITSCRRAHHEAEGGSSEHHRGDADRDEA